MATSASSTPRKSSIKKTVKDQSGAGKIKLGELMSKSGYITATQFETAKREVQKNGARMGAVRVAAEWDQFPPMPGKSRLGSQSAMAGNRTIRNSPNNSTMVYGPTDQ